MGATAVTKTFRARPAGGVFNIAPRTGFVLIAPALALVLISGTARAQAVGDNAVTESDDAFGRQVGQESTGLYSSGDIRGFNPVDAGNARFNSLYFDQVNSPSFRLLEGTTIRVGFSTRGYSFPAPSGLVDYQLTTYGTSAALEIDINGETVQRAPNLAAELRVPIDGERLGVYVGAATLFPYSPDGREHRMDSYGGVVTLRPMPGGEISAFAWRTTQRGEEARPTMFVDGPYLPPEIERGEDLSQPWSDNAGSNRLIGAVAHLPIGGGMRLDAGVFSNKVVDKSAFSDFLIGVDPEGNVRDRAIVHDVGASDHSLSGEVRLVVPFDPGFGEHRATFSVRGRKRDRLFGGDQRISLGRSTIWERDIRDMPTFELGPQSRDEVRQVFFGAAYAGVLFDRLIVDASLSRTDYTKRVDFADPTLDDVETQDSPWLWNLSGAFDITGSLTAFAGVTRGMEDALVAPPFAINRAESPPSIRTSQREAGLRYAMGNLLTAVVGVFRISKPYYNLDPDLRYRLLGTVVNEGVELSMVLNPAAGVTILGGASLSDPKIEGEAVDSGLVGAKPIGQASTSIIGNLDWRLGGGQSPWSFDVAFQRVDGRFANSANTLELPGRTGLDIGFRYRFTAGRANMLLRGRVLNINGTYSWNVSPSGGLTYSNPPRAELQLIADF